MQISNINSIRTYPKICLTGGPCAGKTTAKNYIQQELIKQGYTVFFLSETATEVLKSGITPDTVGLYKFQKAVASLQIQKEELFSDILNHLPENIKPILICDRGVPDSKAFCHIGMYEAILEELQYDEKALKDNYDLVLHLETIAKEKPELYGTSTNKVRRESVEEAINRDNDLIEVWTGMKNYRIIDNKNKTMDDKCHLIMDYINEYLAYTKNLLQYQIFETKNGTFHVLTKFETESQIDEFARTVGRNILSVSDLQILKENLTQNKKSEYCWNVSYYDIQDIPMEQRKVFETPDRIQKAPLLFSNLEKVRNYFQQYIRILDSKKIPYTFQELGVCSNALVFQNIYNKNEKLYGVLDQNGNPDILNEDGTSIIDYMNIREDFNENFLNEEIIERD